MSQEVNATCMWSTMNKTSHVRDSYHTRRRDNMVGVNMVGVNMAFHDAMCECFEGTMLEPCLLKPCVHVAGIRAQQLTT